MLISKIIIFILVIFIICTCTIKIISNIKTKKEKKIEYETTCANGKYIHELIKEAYYKIEDIQSNNNYSVIIYTAYSNGGYFKETFLYKDGYIKEEYIDNKPHETVHSTFTNYKITFDNKNFYVVQFPDITNAPSIFKLSAGDYNPYNIFEWYYNKKYIELGKYTIREETLDNVEYYVINQNGESEMWINKETKLLAKELSFDTTLNSTIISETVYTYTEGNVTDEDVKITSLPGYETFDMIHEIDKRFNVN